METLRLFSCKNCGEKETVKVHITNCEEDEVTVVIKDCKNCEYRNSFNELMEI